MIATFLVLAMLQKPKPAEPNLLDFAAVRTQCQLTLKPTMGGSRHDYDKAEALLTLARVNAFESKWSYAKTYLNRYVREYPSGCGNCAEARFIQSLCIGAVIDAASSPQWEMKLGNLQSGKYAPKQTRLSYSKQQQLQIVREEASLLLAWRLIQDQKPAPAMEQLRKIKSKHSEAKQYAEALMNKISVEKPVSR